MQHHPKSWARIYPQDWLNPIDFQSVFGNDHPVAIDLGSGKGRFLLAHAAADPDTNFLGIERMLSRVRKVSRKIERSDLRNTRLLRMEGYYAMTYLVPPRSVSTLYVFFPDPWPKKRHHDHRVFSPRFLDSLHRSLAPAGIIHAATDHLPYFHEMEELLRADDRFEQVPPFIPTEEEQTDFERYYVQHKQIGRISVQKKPEPPTEDTP